jgi:phage tail sheath protein FI
MIAARGLQRGPWIAPANVPLSGAVGLTPALSAADWSDLFNAQVNLLRQQSGQFSVLSAHTLSGDSLLLQISVRRLLIFLRKLALQRGTQYVFETNNERFRQRVQAGFERVLTLLMEQGALNAFEVVTDSEVNTANDVDNGRFLIALKIAPTQPIEFITVVLLRAGEGLLAAVER